MTGQPSRGGPTPSQDAASGTRSAPERAVRVLMIPAPAAQTIPDRSNGPNGLASVISLALADGDLDRRAAARLLGGPVDSAVLWHLPRATPSRPPGRCRVYLLSESADLQINTRAVDLGARLGNPRASHGLTGPALIVGIGLGGGAADVPAVVCDIARRLGILTPAHCDHGEPEQPPPVTDTGAAEAGRDVPGDGRPAERDGA